ncbi:hypothetical protein BDP55DRAFT_726341 [Colletotrichum godetiae]|uniref:Clr5 domain-containing protein n=1 Tax=Colletotrichum godetiae TaxID=1209918 RepID=A0AAJ0AQC6_9PEZI|nr:uncharacterized protein BDP55DRAFT_726341 [Colletotrichum godetiae]KAK1688431.1 hypothetical protein BDP55DRAFT_726341 [Colletotrichum godetiae]
MDHVEPIEKPNSRARKRSEDIWESLKVVICTEYRNRTLEELIQFLKVEHDFVPTKRQLVYRLGIWKCSKYGGYDLDENEEKENYSEELREIESNKLNNTIQGGFEQKNDHHTDHLDFETPQSASGWLAPMTDSSRDASYYRDFTQLLVQHIYESVVSGSVFVDLADHINRGHRLFEWATETDKAICAIRINHSYGSLMPLPFRKQLEALDELIMDEHPHLLGTLFVIWKNTSLIDDDNTSGRYFINIVNKLCQRLLGSQHLIGKIFACLSTGYFDPAACLERLEVLPSELFAPKDQALEPSFDKYGTSDYQTMSSLYAASEGSLAGAQGLELMSSEASKKPPKRQKTSGKGKDGGRWNRKYPAGDKHEGNESDEGEGGDERPRKVPDRHGGPTNMQFACPFYKWNPLEYQRKKDCAGPGWPTMHRLKEHLYRRHRRLPFQCSRCQKDLVSGTGLDSHLRVAQLCEIKDLIGEFKFGPDIERRLRVRSSPNRTEAERWKQAYIILFDAREDGVPTPYYDYDTSVLDREETWMEYQRREIAIRFRQRVEAEVERRFANVEPELMAGLRDIIQDVGLTMRQAFGRRQEEARNLDREESPAMPPPPPPPPPADLDESSTNTAQTPGNDEEQIAVVLRSPVNRDTGNFLLDDPQQEILFAWPEASGTVTQNQEIEEGDWAWDLSLDANFDTDFLDDVGGNVTL